MDRCTWTSHILAEEGVMALQCEFTDAFCLTRRMQVLYDAAAEFADNLHDEDCPCVLGVGPRNVTNLDDNTWEIAIILHPASGVDPKNELLPRIQLFVQHLNSTPQHFLVEKEDVLEELEKTLSPNDPDKLLN